MDKILSIDTIKNVFSALGAKTSDSNYAVGLFDKTSAEPKGLMGMSDLASVLGDRSFITLADGRALKLFRLGSDWARNGCLVAHFHDQYCGLFLISYTKYSGGNYYKIRCIGDRDTPTFYTDGTYIYLKENYSGGTSAKVVLIGSTEKLESVSIDVSSMTELTVTT